MPDSRTRRHRTSAAARTGPTTAPASATVTAIITTEALLRLLTWLSPAFPTGAYAYSHGIEWAVERGAVRDRASLVCWIADLLACGAGWSDAVLFRQAWHAPDGAALRRIGDVGLALAPSRERHEETTAQASAFIRAVSVWDVLPHDMADDPDRPWPLAVVIATALRGTTLDEDTALTAALHGYACGLVSAAVRLVPLGQTDGLRAVAALEPSIAAVRTSRRGVSLDGIGGFCMASDLASMLHETQATRLFRT